MFILALTLTAPVVARAQDASSPDSENPAQYNDLEDGQPLKLFSYILNPIGRALEWGVTRPLHRMATQSSSSSLFSGSKDQTRYGQNNNADHVPPGTFGPYMIDPSNDMQASNGEADLVPVAPPGAGLAPAQSVPPSKPLLSGSQPALH